MAENYDVIVVGAGASGIVAAGRAAMLGAKVLLVEKMKQAGRKLLITGKGRCNISSDAPLSEYYKNIFPNGRYLKYAFGKFFSGDIAKLLNDQGVETATERGKRIFPASNKAGDVYSGLMNWLSEYPVDILYRTTAEELIIREGKIRGLGILQDNKHKNIHAGKLILCTGGRSYPATGSTGDGYRLAAAAGHTINRVRPALVPLITAGDLTEKMQGLSLKNTNAVLWINDRKYREEFGELLFTHYGLSGPVILTLSRFAVQELDHQHKVEISLDLKPALDEQKLDTRLLRDIDSNGKKQVENLFHQWLPSKMIPVFLQELNIDGKKEAHQISSAERKSIRNLMKDLRFSVTGHRGFKEAIITSGGIATDEVDNRTMQSKLTEGLYFAGEILDLDGNTGGFNLQIAWSTAWLAAESAIAGL
jgi:predicted Rossmann fold flavoprotein